MNINNNSFWLLRKIIDSREFLNTVGGWTAVTKDGKFNIKQAYKMLQGENQRVNWKRLMCNNQATPKSKFILWLALHNRLATADRLSTWNVPRRTICSLCDCANENTQHLFFACTYAVAMEESMSYHSFQRVILLIRSVGMLLLKQG